MEIKLKYLIAIALVLNLIGPVLSFYSLEKIGCLYKFLYPLVTYILDLLSILIWAFVFYKGTKYSFGYALKIAILIYIPNWVFDVFDINQNLRILSSLGFILSIFLVYYFLKHKLQFSNKKFFIYMFFCVSLYLVDSLISEAICVNPVLDRIIQNF